MANVVHRPVGPTSALQAVRTTTKVDGQLVNTFTGSVTTGTFQTAAVVWTITHVSLGRQRHGRSGGAPAGVTVSNGESRLAVLAPMLTALAAEYRDLPPCRCPTVVFGPSHPP
ncbi:hypothetical protein [Streptomyces sp. NPDC005012]|uniref:hypothetical protein n=1 Tax=unclassified Streptomyces TaxID=2593676 RepID=UPI00339FDD38